MEKESTKTTKKPNKKLIIILSIIAVICLAVIGSGIAIVTTSNQEMENIQEQHNSAIMEYNEVIEYKTTWTYAELVDHLVDKSKLSDATNIKITVNGEELNDSSVLEFDTVGSYTVVVDLNKEYHYRIIGTAKEIDVTKEITLNVEDTVFPVFTGIHDISITAGDNLNLLRGISATDAAEGKLDVQVEGKVDTEKAGTYPITVFAIDANGNRADAKFTVTVKEPPAPSNEEASSEDPSTSETNTSSSASASSNTGTSSNADTSSSASSTPESSPGTLTVAEKDSQARAVAQSIANSIMAQGYATDLDKISAAAQWVSSYYYQGVHVESGPDYYTPYGVFVKGESSCAGCTRALGLVLDYMGYSWSHANENQWTHQWVIVNNMDGQVGYADGQVGWAGYGPHPVAQ